MNAPLLARPLALRVADLGDANERARIGAWLLEQPGATPFHLPVWSAAVARGCRQNSHYLVAEGAGGIAGVLPLTEVHSPLFGRALVSAGFGVGGGILADKPATADALAKAAWALAGRLSCPTVELRGGANPGAAWQVDATTYCGFARDLAGDDEAELLAIPRKQRAEVRRSFTNDLAIETGTDAAAHYALYAESVRNLGTPVFPRALFAEVLAGFGAGADMLTVRHQGLGVASVLSLYWNGTVYPYWGGGGEAARALRANDAMYFALMRHARERGCTRFDFGRSKTGTGAAAFKKNWGFEPEPLAYFTRAPEGATARKINPLDPKYSLQVRAWKRLPLWAANRLGPWIARGLG
ncbi:FemAB-related protein (PEP-CTERM system-associated) [Sphingomonas naasensis]|uniref:FemAB family PEP-CTERM system-associated protein n=1 Tax=Sphingomonas naasensis TaxID=1344951 RepID=A0A4S1WT45_9SPHN|nr:FemAB family XrtA/PEP-CTERM system-associated protein [Sphingomonas naasensis]NIJ20490.1 FemAB-related protein (PEP-CTERM system-associated) [Sphingomonas naasensis]TGX44586.1 FemAB family PEP-CTERM system-associated protein [Sphingomonas naasensis]